MVDDQHKKCSACQKIKPVTEFNWQIKGERRQYQCKACRLEKRREKRGKTELTTLQKERRARENAEQESKLFNEVLTRAW